MAAPTTNSTTTSAATSKPATTLTVEREIADANISAFNRMDIPAILSPMSSDFVRHFLPKTLGHPSQDLTRYSAECYRIIKIFRNFRLVVHDVMEDVAARKLVYWLTTEAETDAGPYLNEYMWVYVFGDRVVSKEDGGDGVSTTCQVVEKREFVDSKYSMEFLPKLRAAVKDAMERENGPKE